LFQIDDLRALAERQQWPSISLYLPTHRAGRKETQEDPIRLKNAVAQAKEQLAAAGYARDDANELLAPAAALVTRRDFWLQRADGLALFLAPELFQYYRVPLKLQDEVVVAPHFSLKQLIPLFAEDGRFYILALSQKRIRLLEATRTSIQEHEIPDMLKSIADLKQYHEAREQLQGHTMTLTGTAAPRAHIVFHGQGNIADKATYKADVAQYINMVCKKLEKHLDAQNAPLVLAAVEYEQAFYREANTYRHLLENGILGNPDYLNEDEIHAAAWEVVAPHFAAARQESLGHFADLSNTGKTSARIEEILPAAGQRGRGPARPGHRVRPGEQGDDLRTRPGRNARPGPGGGDVPVLKPRADLQPAFLSEKFRPPRAPTAMSCSSVFGPDIQTAKSQTWRCDGGLLGGLNWRPRKRGFAPSCPQENRRAGKVGKIHFAHAARCGGNQSLLSRQDAKSAKLRRTEDGERKTEDGPSNPLRGGQEKETHRIQGGVPKRDSSRLGAHASPLWYAQGRFRRVNHRPLSPTTPRLLRTCERRSLTRSGRRLTACGSSAETLSKTADRRMLFERSLITWRRRSLSQVSRMQPPRRNPARLSSELRFPDSILLRLCPVPPCAFFRARKGLPKFLLPNGPPRPHEVKHSHCQSTTSSPP